MTKVDYVLNQPQTRPHHCHWPGCNRQVPPAMWGCRVHWFKLPKTIRDKIWKTFRPGQEKDWTPSAAYVEAAKEAQDWIAAHTCPMPIKRIPSKSIVNFVRTGKELEIGRITLRKLKDGSIWMENAAGEGMQVAVEKLELPLWRFFDENF